MKNKRKKAVLGTVLGVGSLISSLIGAGTSIYNNIKNSNAKADAIAEENRQNRINANIDNTNTAMQNINNNLNNNNLDEYYDRFNTNNIFKCGGSKKRKKALLGNLSQYNVATTNMTPKLVVPNQNNINTNNTTTNSINKLDIASGVGSIIGSIGSSIGNIIASNKANNVKKEYYRPNQVNILGRTNQYSNDNLNNLPMYKQGGKKSCK